MELIEKKTGNTIWQFYCESYGNRSGFVHHVELYKGKFSSIAVSTAHIQYYNRTWEHYRYQTAMLSCISKMKERILKSGVDFWKKENGKTRIMKSQKEAVYDAIRKTKEYMELDELYSLVMDAKYGTEDEREYMESLDRALNIIQAIKSLMSA